MIKLRPPQEAAIAAVREAYRAGRCRTIVNLPTGVGKTIAGLALCLKGLRERGTHALWLAHREELIDQPRRAALALGYAPEEVGVVKAERDEIGRALTIACTATLARDGRLERALSAQPRIVVADECFPAGTMVGDRPIETIRAGDMVPSYDERTRQLTMRRVARVFVSMPSLLLRIHIDSGISIVCTPSHPFLTLCSWKPAFFLDSGEMVLYINDHEDRSEVSMPYLRQDRRIVRTQAMRCESTQAGLLFQRMHVDLLFKSCIGDDGTHESQICIGKNEKKQSNETCGNQGKSQNEVACNGMEAADPGRQREADSSSTDASVVRARMADRNRRFMREEKRKMWAGMAAELLQDRHCELGPEDWDRSRRTVSLRIGSQEARRAQRGVLEWRRVDRIEVLEPGDNGEFERLCENGLVYNLEVEETHTYIADGFVVHNCHHFAADTGQKILAAVDPAACVVGLTATLERGDRKSLRDAFPGDVSYQYPLGRAIEDGFLVPFQFVEVGVPGLDLSDVRTTSAGDLAQDELQEAFERALDDLTAAAADAWFEHCRGRTAIAFCVYVRAAFALREALRARGARAEVVHGGTPEDERRAILAELGAGHLDVVANVQVMTEGVDVPRADCAIMARPTESKSLYVQMVGRILRTFVDPQTGREKENALVIDLVGNCGAHSMFQAAALIEDLECESRTREGFERDDGDGRPPIRELRARRTWVNWVPVGKALAASGPDRKLVVVRPVGDSWTVDLWTDRVRETLVSGADRELAFGVGDDAARRLDAKSLMKRDASWRDRPPSPKLVQALAKWGVALDPNATAGQASDLMTMKIAMTKIL